MPFFALVIFRHEYRGAGKGQGVALPPPPVLDKSVNPIPTRGADYPHLITTGPSDCCTCRRLWDILYWRKSYKQSISRTNWKIAVVKIVVEKIAYAEDFLDLHLLLWNFKSGWLDVTSVPYHTSSKRLSIKTVNPSWEIMAPGVYSHSTRSFNPTKL